MAELLPFVPGIPHQRMDITLAASPMVVEARWNSQDEAYYLDFFDVDDNPIARSLKVVLGVNMIRRSTHELFRNRMLVAIDYSGTGVECGIDDLGARIQIAFFTEIDIMLASAPPKEIPRE